MLYKIEMLDGSIKWMNERIIMKISSDDDGTFILTHFNDVHIKIKSFKEGV